MSAAPTITLGVEPVLLRRAAWIYVPFSVALFAAAIATPILVVLWLPRPAAAPVLVPFVALMAAGMAFGAFAMWRMRGWLREQRAVFSEAHVEIRVPRLLGLAPGVPRRVPWRDVYFDGTRLLAGRDLVPLRLPLGPIFDPARVEEAMSRHLRRGHRLAPASLTVRAWRAGAFRAQIAGVLLGLAAGAVAILLLDPMLTASLQASP